MPDPYKILGLERTATLDDIRQAYRIKAAKYHPDQGGDAWVFQQVNEAYAALTKQNADRETTPPSVPEALVPTPVVRKRSSTPPSPKADSIEIEINKGAAKPSSSSATPNVRASTNRRARGNGIGIPLFGALFGGICAIVASYFIVESLRPGYWRNTFFTESATAASRANNKFEKNDSTDSSDKNSSPEAKKTATEKTAHPIIPNKATENRQPEKNPATTTTDRASAPAAPKAYRNANSNMEKAEGKRPLTFDLPDKQSDNLSAKTSEKKKTETSPKSPISKAKKPSEADLKAARDHFRGTLEKELEWRKSHGERVEGAQNILAQALQPEESDPARVYVLFERASEIASTTQTLDLNLRIIDEFSQAFEIETLKRQEAVIAEICQVRDGTTPPLALSVEFARRAFKEILSNRVELGAELLQAAKKLAKEDDKYSGFLTQATKDCERFVDENKKARAIEMEIVDGKTRSAAELRTLGLYQGVVLKDWDKGLKALSECNDKPLAEAARMEIDLRAKDSPTLAEAQAIGSLWRKVAEKEKVAWYALGLYELMSQWDDQIVGGLSPADTFAKHRLEEFEIRRANLIDPVVLLPEVLAGRAFHVFAGNDRVIDGARIQNRGLFVGKLRWGNELNAPCSVENNVAVVTFPNSPDVPFRYLSFYQVGHEVACDLLDANKKTLSSSRVRWSP